MKVFWLSIRALALHESAFVRDDNQARKRAAVEALRSYKEAAALSASLDPAAVSSAQRLTLAAQLASLHADVFGHTHEAIAVARAAVASLPPSQPGDSSGEGAQAIEAELREKLETWRGWVRARAVGPPVPTEGATVPPPSSGFDPDESPALVIDMGRDTTKAGFAGDDAPRAVFRTLVSHSFV